LLTGDPDIYPSFKNKPPDEQLPEINDVQENFNTMYHYMIASGQSAQGIRMQLASAGVIEDVIDELISVASNRPVNQAKPVRAVPPPPPPVAPPVEESKAAVSVYDDNADTISDNSDIEVMTMNPDPNIFQPANPVAVTLPEAEKPLTIEIDVPSREEDA
jgi:hypothetical protein